MKLLDYTRIFSAAFRRRWRVFAHLARHIVAERCIKATALVYDMQSGTKTGRLPTARWIGGPTLPIRILNRLNSSLERVLPEQRLFLRSENATRFVRLRPVTQMVALGGTALVFGWSIVASSILVIDAISSGSSREQVLRAQSAFEERLDTLSAERDARADEALAAQNRFAIALDQVSRMQSQLLSSEERRRELETGMSAVQSTLRDAMVQRDTARTEAETLTTTIADNTGLPLPEAGRTEEFSVALDILSGELKDAAAQREQAVADASEARREVEEIALERDEIVARHDQIFAQLEDAVSISVKPLDQVFRSVGMNPDDVLRTVRRGYSGQGGPLTPLAYSTSGNAAISQGETRANQIIVTLDQMNTYRIAIEKLPLAMPVHSSFRYTSGFGRRWGRMHEGVDMAGPVGTPITTTGDGTVTFAGWQSGYGNLIKIQHELGTETRYGHLSRIRVKTGQRVSQGDRIGDMGNTGRSTGPHLHYEVRVNGRAVNPMSFIKAASNVF